MTSGGDAPGMNGAVRACVRMAIAKGCEAFCVYEGYAGLVQGGDLIKKMGWEDVRGFLSEGGTLIGTARCMEFMQRPGRLTAAKVSCRWQTSRARTAHNSCRTWSSTASTPSSSAEVTAA